MLLIDTNWDHSLIDILSKSHKRVGSFDLFGAPVELQQKNSAIVGQNSSLYAFALDLKTVEEAADHML